MSKLCGNCGGIGCETVTCHSCGGSGKRSDEQRLNAQPAPSAVVGWRERMEQAIYDYALAYEGDSISKRIKAEDAMCAILDEVAPKETPPADRSGG